MIPGNWPVKIAKYLMIDHCAEGMGYIYPKPGEDEEIIGIPAGYDAPGSMAYIQHWRGVEKYPHHSVNCADVAIIFFEEPEEKKK